MRSFVNNESLTESNWTGWFCFRAHYDATVNGISFNPSITFQRKEGFEYFYSQMLQLILEAFKKQPICIFICWSFKQWVKWVQIRSFFLVRIFPHSDWIRRFSPYSVRMRENTDQKKLLIWKLFTQYSRRINISGCYEI